MRGLLFIGLLLGLVYVAYLQMSKVKEHDLDKVDTQIEETRVQVEAMIEENQRKFQEASKQNQLQYQNPQE